MSDAVAGKPDLSIILCMYNPRWDILQRVLDCLARQTLPQGQWELIVIDNNSSPPLRLESLTERHALPLKLIREPLPGVPRGRSRGIDEVKADLILMLDDDNLLDSDYLEAAVRVARENPTFGAFGGIARPEFEHGRVRKWQEQLLPFLAIRDFGPTVITSNEDNWGPWEPVGAGMVVRTDVARKFADYVRNVPKAASLDRRGKALLSGYDSLLARCSYRLNYYCSYQPALKLTHVIKRQRMKMGYLIRLLYGHGRTIILLNAVLEKPSATLPFRELLSRFMHRVRREGGLGGAVKWAWDLGYYTESRAEADRASKAAGTDFSVAKA